MIFPCNTSNIEVLRRPIESAQYPSIRYTERMADEGIVVVNWRSRVKQPDSNKPVSRITGEVHPGVTRFENRNAGPSHGRKHTELDE